MQALVFLRRRVHAVSVVISLLETACCALWASYTVLQVAIAALLVIPLFFPDLQMMTLGHVALGCNRHKALFEAKANTVYAVVVRNFLCRCSLMCDTGSICSGYFDSDNEDGEHECSDAVPSSIRLTQT